MKSLYDISWKVNEEEYRSDPAYSYSVIARFNREGFNGLGNLYDKIETPSLLFGSMVDTLLTDGQEEFDRKYEVAELPNISDSLAQIAKMLFNTYHESCKSIEQIPDDAISKIGESCGYYSNPKYASYRIRKIKEECRDYYSLLFLSKGKTLVSTKDYISACECVEVLKTHRMTKWYFECNNPFNPEVERFYQLKFKGEWNKIPLRCMADLLIVNHKEKYIIPCDLKTSGKSEWEFYKSFIDWNYWIQAQLYWYLIRQTLDKDEFYRNYKLLDYRFIVINRYNKKPLVWIYDDTSKFEDHVYGRNKQYLCRHWSKIVSELHYYSTHNVEYPANISEINVITNWLNNE